MLGRDSCTRICNCGNKFTELVRKHRQLYHASCLFSGQKKNSPFLKLFFFLFSELQMYNLSLVCFLMAYNLCSKNGLNSLKGSLDVGTLETLLPRVATCSVTLGQV